VDITQNIKEYQEALIAEAIQQLGLASQLPEELQAQTVKALIGVYTELAYIKGKYDAIQEEK